MIAKWILRLKCPAEQMIEGFCDRFPLLSSICLQLAAAIFMIGAVGSIAVVGGTVIWLFYRAFGVM